jgi:peroxiredoxin Q/BCP
MAQLRLDYQQFVARDAEIIVVGPEDRETFDRFWQEKHMPFIGLSDPEHTVANRYGQEVSLMRLGRMPALLVIDKAGRVRYAHYGSSMQDIPKNADILALLDELNSDVG